MRFEPWVGLRYLMATRGRRAPSAITLISVFAVAVGVVVPILVLSVMGGFESDLRTKILGSRAHLLVTGEAGENVRDPGAMIALLEEQELVTGVSPFVEADVMASSSTNYSGAVLRGIDPERAAQATDLLSYIVEGDIAWLAEPELALDARDARLGYGEAGDDLQALLDETRASADALRSETERLEQAIREAQARRERPDENIALPEPVERDGTREEPAAADDAADGSGQDREAAPTRRMPPPVAGATDAPRRRPPPVAGAAGSGPPPVEPVERREPAGILIGSEMQRTLHADVGDVVQLINPDGDVGPTGRIPRSWPHRIVGIYHTGLYEFDSSVIYLTLDDARSFLDVPAGEVTGIEVRTTDVSHADHLAVDVRAAMAARDVTGVAVRDWQELNRNLFAALKLEKLAMSFVLLFISVVASFAVLSVLIMIVLRRRDEIAILRAMGASQRAIRNVFVVQGLAIGASGTLLGLLVSGALVAYLTQIGFPLDAEVYYIDQLPVDVQALEIAAVAFGSLFISLVATIPPSVQAARLDPAQGLRNE